jgi:plastocyanin
VTRALGVATVLVALTTLAGCGADGSDVPIVAAPTTTVATSASPAADAPPDTVPVAVTNPATVTTTGVTVNVIAIDNTFRAQDTKAKVGDTVTFTNKGKNDHDVLPQSGTAWGVHVAGFHPGDTYSYVFTAPGVYPFFCSIHGTNLKGMVGTITVTG